MTFLIIIKSIHLSKYAVPLRVVATLKLSGQNQSSCWPLGEYCMKHRGIVLAALTGICAAFSVNSSAHHSFSAEFDENNCRDFTGILTDVDWQNPHAFFYMDVLDENGEVHNWSFQTYALITLKRAGTGLDYFKRNIGKEVWVRGCLAKNGRDYYASAGLMRAEDGELRQMGQIQN